CAAPEGAPASAGARPPAQGWLLAQLQPLTPAARVVRLPVGRGSLAAGGTPLPSQPAVGGGQWLQLPPLEGVTLRRLWRKRGGARPSTVAVPAAAAPLDPVRVIAGDGSGAGSGDGSGARRWRLENALLAVQLGPEGIEQIWDRTARPCLAAPLAWRRWADRGEFWDAWDIAADHRAHPLPWTWHGAPQWLERGPLCARFLWRGRCGASPLRLEGRLRAASPCLELTLAVDWRQRHELLRLELPLARPALRWAADTPGGVIERPAAALTGPEQARWEVAALRWLASVETAAGGGVAVLLDGPQGVSGDQERLGVSLLRAPTWPDPGADNGWQRQRLAVMPCPRGWRADGVPAAALRLREPLWCRPQPAAAAPGAADLVGSDLLGSESLPLWPALPPDVEMISLRRDPCEGQHRALLVALQNLGPCLRCWAVPPGWQLLEQVDGLGRATVADPASGAARAGDGKDELRLRPWQLAFWRLVWTGDQSS
ncbi:MAG: glycoside hydrolase family 38 C-terminal domain-containing protein, partial [Cyanobium sp.]